MTSLPLRRLSLQQTAATPRHTDGRSSAVFRFRLQDPPPLSEIRAARLKLWQNGGRLAAYGGVYVLPESLTWICLSCSADSGCCSLALARANFIVGAGAGSAAVASSHRASSARCDRRGT